MSNPYDPNAGNNNPYGGSDPSGSGGYGGYGNTGGNTGGGGGYGAPYGQPASPYDEGPKKTDAVSIVGFVLSLTCCLSIVGAILGFVGLSRTKGGKRKGRWAAIAAAIIGTLLTIGVVVGGVFIYKFADSVVEVDEAKVGDCADVSSDDGDSVLLTDQDCDGKHDAEITWVGKVSDVESLDVAPSNPDDFTDAGASYLICTNLMDKGDVTALGDDVEYQYVTEDTSPKSTDAALCYAEKKDGKFTDKQLP
jgi:hypothetical protein